MAGSREPIDTTGFVPPRTFTRRRVIAGSGLAAIMAGIALRGGGSESFAQGIGGTPIANNYTSLPVMPPELTQYENDWPAPNGNLSNTRAAKKSTIDSKTVNNLEVAWTFPIKGTGASGGTTCLPIVAGNAVYVQDQHSNVFAIDRDTGKQIWSKMYDLPTEGPNGVAIGYGKIYGSTGDSREVFALDAKTGEEVWKVLLSGNAREGIDMAPQVYGGLVYISTVPGNSGTFYDGGARGILYALDATSGQIIWQFYTTDADLWGNPTINSGGGSWYPPAVDASGYTYWDVANPAPFFPHDVDGTPVTLGSTFDDGLYSNCLVKLSPEGVMEWFYAANRHDIFDHDLQQSPMLVTVANNGQPYTVAVSSGKLGRVIAVEVENGWSVWTTEVGEHTPWNNAQWIPPGQTVTVAPGVLGGVEGPISYADETVFVPIMNFPAKYTDQGIDLTALSVNDSTGQLTALNIFDGTVKWNADMPAGNVAGSLVSNDLVFTGGLDGVVRAYTTADGSLVWSYDTNVGLNAPFAVAGDLLVVPAAGLKLVSSNYKPEATPVAVGDSGPAIIGFKLKS